MDASLTDLLNRVPVILRRPDGTILHWSQGCEELFGYEAHEALGQRAHELLKTAFPEPEQTIQLALDESGKWEGRLCHTHRSGREIWTEAVWRQRESSAPGGLIVVEQSTDITERVELEARSALIAAELEHRVRNVLSVVQSLARVTFPDAPPEQRRKMEERIAALAEANKLLQKGSWKEAGLREIASEVARTLGIDERIAIAGPDVAISSHQAMDLALAIHELCTNAIKYGALGVAGGTAKLTWSVDEADPLVVHARWEERGGPLVAPPDKGGFGTRLIRQALSRREGAPAAIHFEPSGVVCEFSLLIAERAPI